MKPGLSLRTAQQLTLTTQLQQSIRLLQLSSLELQQEVEGLLLDNPLLEREEEPWEPAEREAFGLPQADTPVSAGDRALEWDASSTSGAGTERDEGASDPLDSDAALSWEGDGSADLSYGDGHWEGEPLQDNANPANANTAANAGYETQPYAAPSLAQFLREQTLAWRLQPVERAALEFLIESLNEDGYLEDPVEDLVHALHPQDAEQIEVLQHHFTVALGLLHTLEPAGVGARSVAECLRLQLRAAPGVPPAVCAVALQVCEQPLELLARRDVRRYVQLGLGSAAQVEQALACIARLEPKPGRRFGPQVGRKLLADVLVRPLYASGRAPGSAAQAQWDVQLNPAAMPRLRTHRLYSQLVQQHRRSDTTGSYAALQQQLQEARWLIKSIHQRFDTILRTSRAIVERQKAFFTHGPLAMRPLVLRDIADELGLHESTLSRVTNGKYMDTPQGILELKYFFGSGLATDAGGSASSTAVRSLIQQCIANESPQAPLSDQHIAELLQQQGIVCARRTVAKYREGLKIPVASLRRRAPPASPPPSPSP